MNKHYYKRYQKSEQKKPEQPLKKEENTENITATKPKRYSRFSKNNNYENNEISKEPKKEILTKKDNEPGNIAQDKLNKESINENQEEKINTSIEENNKNDLKEEKIEINKNKKQSEYEIMDNLFNEVEKFNAKNILKGDLADIYNEIIKNNSDFKENIFFVNLNHYENMIGNCDNKVIQHSYKDMKKEELLKNKYLPLNELYNKYANKAKIIRGKNEL